jgi:penicillin-binding protein 1C
VVPLPGLGAAWSTALYDRAGVLLGAAIASDGQWRFPEGGVLPLKYREALVLYEDSRFYVHPGVDPLALLRAALQNARAGRVVSGGSTITMQVVRLSRPGKARTMGEKLLEAALALRLELAYGKEKILRLYASRAPMGGNVVGIEAASWRYFGRAPAGLSWAEAALLAVMPNNPGVLHPGRYRDLLKEKRDRLLSRLQRLGRIDAETARLSMAESLPEAPRPLPRLAPHLLARAMAEGAGSRIQTSLDAQAQARVAAALERRRPELALKGIRNAACLVLDLKTGKALAYVGNAESPEGGEHGQDVDAVMARRSTGSLLKPFLYAAMIDSGELLPHELVIDIPIRIGSYSPENSTERYLGAVPANEALARSLNVPAVRELRSFGVERFARFLASLGMGTLDRRYEDYGLPLILGGAEGRLWDMVSMYAGLGRAAQGSSGANPFWPASYLAGASPRKGGGAPLSRAAAWLTLEALAFVARPGEEAAWQDYASSRKIAWKTGTSFGYRDAWSIGLTPEIAVGVWMGNADGQGRPDLKGSAAAAPLLFEIFSAFRGRDWFPEPPNGLSDLIVCADSGFPAGPDCARTAIVQIPAGAKARPACPYCRTILTSADGRYRVDQGSDPRLGSKAEKAFVLPPSVEAYYRAWNFSYRGLPPREPGRKDQSSGRDFSITVPESGSRIYIPIELNGEEGMAVFQAADRRPDSVLYWHVDERYMGSTRGDHRIQLRLAAGEHLLTLVDQDGASDSRRFEVLNER